MNVIGRISETTILLNALENSKPELIVVFGRRRIGKTFLIRNVYRNRIVFEFSGIHNAPFRQQLENFHLTMAEKDTSFKRPAGWVEAFHQLGSYVNKIRSKKKKIIFIDEFPWLDTRKSNFLAAFDNFWNSFASKRNDLVVVICGSAASYMIQNIVRSKGGLHNRITEKIRLLPFNLAETENFLVHNKVKLSRYDIAMLYMAIGGIPHYLEKIRPGESTSQAIDRLGFHKDGFLRSEFENVFASLFNKHENHEMIIRTLASVRKGMTRNAILAKSKINSGGTLSKTLADLEESGFIEKYLPYKGSKDAIFRLTDEYSLFYLNFIEKTKPSKSSIWAKIQEQQSWKIWSGFSFESLCLKHISQIKERLKISGINSSAGSWHYKSDSGEAQIDLIIDRADNVINLCEIKFYNSPFRMDKKCANNIMNKVNLFKEITRTRKSIFVTMITAHGLNSNEYSRQIVQNELKIDSLFIDL